MSGWVHKCVCDQMLPGFPRRHEAHQCPIGSGRQQFASRSKRRNHHHTRISWLSLQTLGTPPYARVIKDSEKLRIGELENCTKLRPAKTHYYQKANTHDTRIFVIHPFRNYCLLCFPDDRQHKWRALIAAIGTYTNIDLVGKVISVIRLNFTNGYKEVREETAGVEQSVRGARDGGTPQSLGAEKESYLTETDDWIRRCHFEMCPRRCVANISRSGRVGEAAAGRWG